MREKEWRYQQLSVVHLYHQQHSTHSGEVNIKSSATLNHMYRFAGVHLNIVYDISNTKYTQILQQMLSQKEIIYHFHMHYTEALCATAVHQWS